MRISIASAMFAAFVAALSSPAAAADCAPLTRIATLALEPDTEQREEFVPVTISGVRKLMLLDTGGAMTEITTEAADELQLVRRRGGFRLLNMYGESSDQFVQAELAIGPLKPSSEDLAIAPGNNSFGEDHEIAGVLAPDILMHYDVDIDFGTDTLNLYSQNHCDGQVVYWKADSVSVIPIRVQHSGQILVDVLLDGLPVTAILDTGAHNTTLTLPVAEGTFGLKLGSADAPRSGNLAGLPNANTYRHVFSTLTIGGIVVGKPQVEIIPDLLHQVVADATLPPTGSRLRDPRKLEGDATMLIGMNVLRRFHIYIAYREEKLYITSIETKPVSAPAADVPPRIAPGH